MKATIAKSEEMVVLEIFRRLRHVWPPLSNLLLQFFLQVFFQ